MESVSCPQQTNCYDCGIFSLLFASIIFKAIETGGLEEEIDMDIDSDDEKEEREEKEGEGEHNSGKGGRGRGGGGREGGGSRGKVDISSILSRLVERAGPAAAEGYRIALRREVMRLKDNS